MAEEIASAAQARVQSQLNHLIPKIQRTEIDILFRNSHVFGDIEWEIHSDPYHRPVLIIGIPYMAHQPAHAVLAYKYKFGKQIWIYDPNSPDKEITITPDNIESAFPNFGNYWWYVVSDDELYKTSVFEQLFNKYKDKICFPCSCIAGIWHACEEFVVTCTAMGETETEEIYGCASIDIEQNGCEVRWEVEGYERAGTIDGNHIHISGIFFVPLVSGVSCTQNIYTAEGTIGGDEINFSGSGIVTGTFCDEDGCYSFSCTGSSTGTLTRVTGTYQSSKTIKETDISNGGPLFIFGITNSDNGCCCKETFRIPYR